MSVIDTRNQGLDKFYTNSNIVEDCIKTVSTIYPNWNDWGLVVEPSAGNGSFLKQLPIQSKIGLDISPDDVGIIQMDFFDYTPILDNKKCLVIGNPPFGKVCSLAIKFFNHASQWADTIAFIIPRTFRRTSIHNKLNKYFHLIHDNDIPLSPCSFTPNMMVKCCFQVWQCKDTARELIKTPIIHPDFEFIPFGPKDDKNQPTPPENVDFAIRAYGGKCGEIKTDNLHSLRPKSWHWIKSNIDKDELIERLTILDYTNSLNTARQNSLGKAELILLYTNCMNTKL